MEVFTQLIHTKKEKAYCKEKEKGIMYAGSIETRFNSLYILAAFSHLQAGECAENRVIK